MLLADRLCRCGRNGSSHVLTRGSSHERRRITLVSRRTLLMMVSIAAGGLASAIVNLPIAGFLLAPLIRKPPPV